MACWQAIEKTFGKSHVVYLRGQGSPLEALRFWRSLHGWETVRDSTTQQPGQVYPDLNNVYLNLGFSRNSRTRGFLLLQRLLQRPFHKLCLPLIRSSLGIRGVNLTSLGLHTCLECTTRGECNLRHLPINIPPSKDEDYQAHHDSTLLDVLSLRYCYIAHHIFDIYKW